MFFVGFPMVVKHEVFLTWTMKIQWLGGSGLELLVSIFLFAMGNQLELRIEFPVSTGFRDTNIFWRKPLIERRHWGHGFKNNPRDNKQPKWRSNWKLEPHSPTMSPIPLSEWSDPISMMTLIRGVFYFMSWNNDYPRYSTDRDEHGSHAARLARLCRPKARRQSLEGKNSRRTMEHT
jgi:hypothetical protein